MVFLPQSNYVVRRSPLSELEKFNREMGRFFDSHQVSKEGAEAALLGRCWAPAVDIWDKKDKVVVKVELPGMQKEDIDISIENNLLSIQGEKKEDSEQSDGEMVRTERYYGTFYRAFTLSASVDPQKVTAKFVNGVLDIQILKRVEAQSRQVKIDVQ